MQGQQVGDEVAAVDGRDIPGGKGLQVVVSYQL